MLAGIVDHSQIRITLPPCPTHPTHCPRSSDVVPRWLRGPNPTSSHPPTRFPPTPHLFPDPDTDSHPPTRLVMVATRRSSITTGSGATRNSDWGPRPGFGFPPTHPVASSRAPLSPPTHPVPEPVPRLWMSLRVETHDTVEKNESRPPTRFRTTTSQQTGNRVPPTHPFRKMTTRVGWASIVGVDSPSMMDDSLPTLDHSTDVPPNQTQLYTTRTSRH